MKKIILGIFCCSLFTVTGIAQVVKEKPEDETKEESGGGFKKDRLFVGGTVALGFGSGTTSFGLGPYFGYSLNKYVDVAISVNYNYVSQKQFLTDFTGNSFYLGKARQNIIGPGAFVRVFPVKFLYAQVQYEQNFITYKFLPEANSGILPFKETRSVGSLLVGPGLAQGRSEFNRSYGYISVLFDVAKNINSPYVNNGSITPIIRAGYNIALFQGNQNKGGGRNRRDRY
ncbi:MAG: hypothetical protein WKF88_06505 [Ferruginibacter sp.]